MMLNLREDVEEMFGSLNNCFRLDELDRHLQVEWRLCDPHAAADRFILDHDRGESVAAAKVALATEKDPRARSRLRAVIYNAANRAAINARQRARDAKKRAA